MREASTGFSAPAAARPTASATSWAEATTGGTKRTMTASMPGSASTYGSTCSYVASVAEPSMSTGFATLASAGRTPRRAAAVSGESAGNSSPAASQASAQRIPRPPAFVRTATRRPRGSGCVEKRAAASISSPSVRARITPAWWKSAFTAASEPARAAVCELAARAPVAVVPLFIARIGFVRATRRAIRANRRGFPNDSR